MNWLRKLWQDFAERSEWRVIAATYLFVAGAAGIGGAFSENRWLLFFNAALAGWCLHGAIGTRMMQRYRNLLDETHKALREAHELNKALLENKARLYLAKVEIMETDDGPAKTLN